MTADFQGRVALVTGAGRGLGRAYVLELARRGAGLVVNDLSAADAEAVASEIVAAGGIAVAQTGTVATRAGGSAAVAHAIDAFGRIDVLINNAGILRQAPFEDIGDDDIDALINVHLKAAFYSGQAAFRAMKRQGYGRILFTASSSGLFGHPGHAAYGAAKAALLRLSNVVALEGKDHGIHANVIMPSALTGMNVGMDMSWVTVFPEISQTLARLSALPANSVNRLCPVWVVPLAIYLVNESCTTTHGLFSACSGRYARIAISSGARLVGGNPADHRGHRRPLGGHLQRRALHRAPKRLRRGIDGARSCGGKPRYR